LLCRRSRSHGAQREITDWRRTSADSCPACRLRTSSASWDALPGMVLAEQRCPWACPKAALERSGRQSPWLRTSQATPDLVRKGWACRGDRPNQFTAINVSGAYFRTVHLTVRNQSAPDCSRARQLEKRVWRLAQALATRVWRSECLAMPASVPDCRYWQICWHIRGRREIRWGSTALLINNLLIVKASRRVRVPPFPPFLLEGVFRLRRVWKCLNFPTCRRGSGIGSYAPADHGRNTVFRSSTPPRLSARIKAKIASLATYLRSGSSAVRDFKGSA
jgi:hypothetical protein